MHCSYGDIARALYALEFRAHRVAVRAPVGLRSAILEGTEPSAQMWRSFGIYRAQVPVSGSPGESHPPGSHGTERYRDFSTTMGRSECQPRNGTQSLTVSAA